MNYTQNYQLNQWAESDRVLMEDFNADNRKIEAALLSKRDIAIGQYIGDGSASRFIPLGFTPSLVIITDQTGQMKDDVYHYGGIALEGSPASGAEIVENGFNVKNEGNYIWYNNGAPNSPYSHNYLYIAIK